MKEIGTTADSHSESHPPTPDNIVWPSPVAGKDSLWLDPERSRSAKGAAQPGASVPALTGTSGLWRPDTPSPSNGSLWRSDAFTPSQATVSNVARPTSSVPPQTDASVPLAPLMSSGVPIEWHHAVAVVQQLIDQLAVNRCDAPAGSVPPIETIRLTSSGRLGVELGPADEPFARGVGRVLAKLLESNPAPANLRLLALEAASESDAPIAFDDLARQLAGWERPGRTAALSALYAQARAVADGTMVVPPALPVEAPLARPDRDAASPKLFAQGLRSPTLLYVAAAALLAIALAAFGIYSMFSPSPPPVVDVGPPSVSTAPPTSSPEGQDVELKRAEPLGPGRPASTRAARVASAPSAPPVVERTAQPIVDEIVAIPVESDAIPSVPLEILRASAPAPTPPTIRESSVFSSNDIGVSEPILVKPYLPPSPRMGTPSDVLGVLELLVDARGAVETVHLRSPSNRYREKWWVFAAKQWQFQPALKNGKPVKFLKRIPLTDLNVLEPQ